MRDTESNITHVRRGLDVAPRVLLDAERLEDLSLGAQETKGEEDELGREELLRAGHLLHLPAPAAVLRPLDADGVEALELPVLVDDELLGRDAVLAGIWTSRLVHVAVILHGIQYAPFPK